MSRATFVREVTVEPVAVHARDHDVVAAARVSTGTDVQRAPRWQRLRARLRGEPEPLSDRDRGLIDFLMRERHGTPFEHGRFTFHVEAPIAVAREHMRHRAGHSYNEESGRYRELPGRFFMPSRARRRVGRPGAYRHEEAGENDPLTITLQSHLAAVYLTSWRRYQMLLDAGVAPEQARLVLPLGTMTRYRWTCNPRSLMHFAALRAAPTAMAEIRAVAEAALRTLARAMPWTARAFSKHGHAP